MVPRNGTRASVRHTWPPALRQKGCCGVIRAPHLTSVNDKQLSAEGYKPARRCELGLGALLLAGEAAGRPSLEMIVAAQVGTRPCQGL